MCPCTASIGVFLEIHYSEIFLVQHTSGKPEITQYHGQILADSTLFMQRFGGAFASELQIRIKVVKLQTKTPELERFR